MAYTKLATNVKYLIFVGFKPDSKDEFTLAFNEEWGLVGVIKETWQPWRWKKLDDPSRSASYSSKGPWTEKRARDYFTGIEGEVSEQVYAEKILPLLNHWGYGQEHLKQLVFSFSW